MQAFSGGSEMLVGGSPTLYSAGVGAIIGVPILAHGADQCWTGLRQLYTGVSQYTATAQLLQMTGISPQNASLVNNSLSIFGFTKGAALIRSGQNFIFPTMRFSSTIPTIP